MAAHEFVKLWGTDALKSGIFGNHATSKGIMERSLLLQNDFSALKSLELIGNARSGVQLFGH